MTSALEKIDGHDVPVWPEGQEVRALDDEGLVLRTDFADAGIVNVGLRAEIERRLIDPSISQQRNQALGGNKRSCLYPFQARSSARKRGYRYGLGQYLRARRLYYGAFPHPLCR